MVAQQPGAPEQARVLLSGIVPPLADAFYPRPETGPDLVGTLPPGQTIVLTHGGESDSAPAAQGGTGKTQLAVEFAHALWNGKLVEVLVWVTASHRESIVSGFAQAANTVDASSPGEDAEAAAARFVSWLAHTKRPWALILDDLADVAELAGPVAAGPVGADGDHYPAAGLGVRGPGRPGRPGARHEPAGDAGLPQLAADRPSGSADQGTGPRRGPRRPAARAGPGHRGHQRPPAGLPGLPGGAGRAPQAHVRGGWRVGHGPGHLVTFF